MFDAILVSGVDSAGVGRHRWLFWILTAVTLATRWWHLLSESARALDLGSLTPTVLWLATAIGISITQFFRQRDVGLDTILGAIVTYLLAAVAFAVLFQIMEVQKPGSFARLSDTAAGDRVRLVASMIYFSLVCITTLGFGDVFGQLYLAVLIVRLVGLHLASEANA